MERGGGASSTGDTRGAACVHAAAIGVAVGLAAGRQARSTSLATWSAVAGRALGQAAIAVSDALVAGDLDARPRARCPRWSGAIRPGSTTKEVARAVVESVAENTVDAVVAPALWAAVAGAPGVLAHRAVNTMDAMVGHRCERYERYGWAAARLDDGAALGAGPGRRRLLVAAVPADARPEPSGARCAMTRRPTRRRTAAWSRLPSPLPSACGSAARAGTATEWSCVHLWAHGRACEARRHRAGGAPEPRGRRRARRRRSSPGRRFARTRRGWRR